jgi:hypothetical protein
MEGFADGQPATTRDRQRRAAWIRNQLKRYELAPGKVKRWNYRPEALLGRYEDRAEQYREAGVKRPYGKAAEELARDLGITVKHLQQNNLPEWRKRVRNGLDDPAHRWRKGVRHHRA